jgi:D-3-phosphoglycerate dehydrogenase
MVLASLRNFAQEIANMQSGIWQTSIGRQLQGRTLAILGLGRIGEQVARAGHTLGAEVLIWGRESSRKKALENGWRFAASREEFFSQADVLCVLLRLTQETTHQVTASDLALMKTDAILVNTARAEIIEPNALYNALRLGRPGFAAVDVYEKEPVLLERHPLQDLKNCLCTPHLGFVEKDNFENYMSQAFDGLNALANQG